MNDRRNLRYTLYTVIPIVATIIPLPEEDVIAGNNPPIMIYVT